MKTAYADRSLICEPCEERTSPRMSIPRSIGPQDKKYQCARKRIWDNCNCNITSIPEMMRTISIAKHCRELQANMRCNMRELATRGRDCSMSDVQMSRVTSQAPQ